MITADARMHTEVAPELLWVGDAAWVACDAAVPENDPRRVVAYLERKNGRVDVLWVRDGHEVSTYGSLRQAVHAVWAVTHRASRQEPDREESRR
jgi:hypothetical protein